MKTIERLRELEKAATPRPWDNEPYSAFLGDVHAFGVSCDGGESTILTAWGDCEQSKSDAVLCASMRNALPALLAVVEAQAAEIAAWRAAWLRLHKRPGPTGGGNTYYVASGDTELLGATDAAIRALEGGDE